MRRHLWCEFIYAWWRRRWRRRRWWSMPDRQHSFDELSLRRPIVENVVRRYRRRRRRRRRERQWHRTSLVGRLVFTRHSCLHGTARSLLTFLRPRRNPLDSLSLPLSLGHYLLSFSVSRNFVHHWWIASSFLMLVFLLSFFVYLPLRFSFSLFFYRVTSPTRDHTFRSLSLSLSFFASLSQIFAPTEGDFRTVSSPMTMVRRARDTLPTFSLLSLSRPPLSSLSIHHFCLSRFLAFTRTRVHIHGHTASRARESVHVAVDRFSVILLPFRSRDSPLRSHARTIRSTNLSLSTLDARHSNLGPVSRRRNGPVKTGRAHAHSRHGDTRES